MSLLVLCLQSAALAYTKQYDGMHTKILSQNEETAIELQNMLSEANNYSAYIELLS